MPHRPMSNFWILSNMYLYMIFILKAINETENIRKWLVVTQFSTSTGCIIILQLTLLTHNIHLLQQRQGGARLKELEQGSQSRLYMRALWNLDPHSHVSHTYHLKWGFGFYSIFKRNSMSYPLIFTSQLLATQYSCISRLNKNSNILHCCCSLYDPITWVGHSSSA
jgi:hypothetical protein